MNVISKNQVFNLYNTNGRRNDILNAYQIYAEEIDRLKIGTDNVWGRWPSSTTQYDFYKKTLNRSEEVFKRHDSFDKFDSMMESNDEFKNRFYDLDATLKTKKNEKIFEVLDKYIESRARHYTNALLTVGLINKNRELSENGKLIIDPKKLVRDDFEKQLPVNNLSIIILRQALKIRIFDKNCSKYYSPVKLAIFIILITKSKVNIDDLLFIVQGITPYMNIDILDIYNDNGIEGLVNKVKDEISKNFIDYSDDIDKINDFEIFKNVLSNRKSSFTVDSYFEFYNALKLYRNKRDSKSLESLYEVITAHKSILNKAFGFNKSIFNFKNKAKFNQKDFEKDNKDNELIYCDDSIFNFVFVKSFNLSKHYDSIREYSNTTRKLLESSGIISTTNKTISLVNFELFNNVEIKNSIYNDIFCESNEEIYNQYINDYFIKENSLMNILGLKKDLVQNNIQNLKDKYDLDNIGDLQTRLKDERDKEFKIFIEKKFPRDTIFSILEMFSDRKNDSKIKSKVTKDTDVPTIFEYVVGIAWYYLSTDKSYNLIDSFNLALSADFLPIGHAPGGDGDIIIKYNDLDLMLEVTLMNKGAQKRGEWEPVLRHAANLSIESDKKTLSLFIADELDSNTINIWRAISNVPLEYSKKQGIYTTSPVIIMPMQIIDMIKINGNKKFNSGKFFNDITNSYKNKNNNFDTDWYRKIISNNI